eukprot:5565643-Alexandrium_andersonii.AAC.1
MGLIRAEEARLSCNFRPLPPCVPQGAEVISSAPSPPSGADDSAVGGSSVVPGEVLGASVAVFPQGLAVSNQQEHQTRT